MTRQTLKKQLKIRFAEILEDNGILLSAELATNLANAASDIVATRKKSDTCPRDMMLAICNLCQYNPQTMTKAAWAQVRMCGNALVSVDASEADLERFKTWWESDKWRADHLPITPKRIQDSWGAFEQAPRNGSKSNVIVIS